MTQTVSDSQLRSSRRRLLILVALFLGPLLAAWVLYFGFGGAGISGSAAHGELISPALPLADIDATYALGEKDAPLFRKTWTMVVIAGPRCDKACQDVVLLTRQVRLSLGKEVERIGRILFVDTSGSLPEGIALAHPELLVVDSRDAVVAAQLANFPGADEPARWIYLTDPLGNLMMRYSADVDPRDMHKDLKRLLRLSHIG